MTTEKQTPESIRSTLAQCNGTEGYTKNTFGLLYTDGVAMMAELCQAYWLIDLIESYQPKLRQLGTMRREYHHFHPDAQFWQFRLRADSFQGSDQWHRTKNQVFFPGPVNAVTADKRKACVICAGDWEDGKPLDEVVRQYIEYTNFPLPEGIDLWVESGVLLLPSEH